MPRCLVVADDLTGATDTANQFAARGFLTEWTATGAEPQSDTHVRVFNTESRYETPKKAAKRVRQVIEQNPASVVYKKIDSTLRGNLVPEIDAAVAGTDADLALFVPAFPANGRTTVGDIHLVDGTPVAQTAVGDNLEKPVRSSRLTTILSSSATQVKHLPLEVVNRGHEAIRGQFDEFLDDRSATTVACDATRPHHCSALASAADEVDATVVYVGSGGLAAHVSLSDRRARTLGIVGSVNETTHSQLGSVADDTVVLLDGPRTVTDPTAAVDSVVPDVIETLDRKGAAVVTAARDESDVADTLATARSEGVEEHVARDRVATALGRTAEEIVARTALTGLFVTGGSVAERLLDATGVQGIQLTGQSVADGIPVGTAIGGSMDGIPIVTKAGGFGDEGAIVNSLDHLERYNG